MRTICAAGAVAMALVTTAFIGGFSVLWDRKFGFLKETLVAPAARWQLVVGRCLGTATTATIQTSLILLIVYLMQNEWPGLFTLLNVAVASMAQIAEATREQSIAVTEIAESAEKISIKTQSTDAQVQQTANALNHLQNRADDLLAVANRFRL